MTTPADQLIEQLRSGFPVEIGAQVDAAARCMTADVRYGVHFRGNPETVDVGGQSLRLLLRHGFGPRSLSSMSNVELPVQAAIAARHYNGFIRERSVRPLTLCGELWIMPFLLELASDYVIEIVAELETHFSNVDRASLRQYVADNPAHLEVTAARITSYWNEYYRTGPRVEAATSYAGFRILATIAEL